MKHRKVTWLLCIAFALWAGAASRAQTTDVDLGGMVLSVSTSTTAQVFHIVDQLSEWDQYVHRAYVRWAGKSLDLGPDDKRLLREHAELRRRRGWGNGFEQAFLVNDSIEVAAAKAVANGTLLKDEADHERAILLHFAPRVTGLIEQRRAAIEAFLKRLANERDRLSPLVERLARFAGAANPLKQPVFLVANPEETSGGGRANGGRLVVEVPSPDAMGFLLHEALHALLAPHSEAISTAASSAGISAQALNEGIAYALAPGLTDDEHEGDRLSDELVGDLLRDRPATDAYVQFHMVAAAIRPVLRASLRRDDTIADFLPKAVSKWRSIAGR